MLSSVLPKHVYYYCGKTIIFDSSVQSTWFQKAMPLPICLMAACSITLLSYLCLFSCSQLGAISLFVDEYSLMPTVARVTSGFHNYILVFMEIYFSIKQAFLLLNLLVQTVLDKLADVFFTRLFY